MGVTGLWTVVAPTARPTKLETLNRKRLAVDASIWIYQFLKAVRDKEGNALRNSHVIGFFRRICKLLYFGIKPVFVFDGGAPILKRETVRGRARRREGRREDAVKTAGRLLALQVQRVAEEEEAKRRADKQRAPTEEELPADQDLVYVDEIGMTQQERKAGRAFKRKDQYHLPDLDISIESMGAPNDPRIMSQAELEDYARQFHSGEDINLYDFSKIDFESPFFLSLPPGDRYNILNAARLRSRLRMGYSKEQLDGMFPDRMAFSKFQIERVRERNELTQRLMHINAGDGEWNEGGRIAGEKGKEYVLVRNDGVEGGWALGVVSNKQGSKKENAIDLENEENSDVDAAISDEEEFEDVAIEGLNRIPKTWQKKKDLREVDYDVSYEDAAATIARKRRAVYEARKENAVSLPKPTSAKPTPAKPKENTQKDDGLFVPEENPDAVSNDEDDLFEDVDIGLADENDDELQRAIAMSLERHDDNTDDKTTAGGFVDDSDDEMNLEAALAESRKTRYRPKTNVRKKSPPKEVSAPSQFAGPLPFESLNLGQSLLGKKKADKIESDMSGGFDRSAGDDAFKKDNKPRPMPSWFDVAPNKNDLRGNFEAEDDFDDHITYGREDVFRRDATIRAKHKEVIDLDADDQSQDGLTIADQATLYHPEITDDAAVLDEEVDKSVADDEADKGVSDEEERAEKVKAAEEREERYRLAREIAAENEDSQPLMNDLAEKVQADPPSPTTIPNAIPPKQNPFLQDESSEEEDAVVDQPQIDEVDQDETVEWSESDFEEANDQTIKFTSRDDIVQPANVKSAEDPNVEDEEDDEAFEDVDMAAADVFMPAAVAQSAEVEREPSPAVDQQQIEASPSRETEEVPVQPDGGFDDYLSDSDEELMRQLAIEAEEHARFASSLNNTKQPGQAQRDYETELQQLRNQQKKDRRDADEVTHVMIQECQALLRLFGLPYITAPMEAEAQCAELVHLGLVDGIVTDDSDIFLFGGTRIYKNMFNQAKFVECYLATDLEKEFALDRQKLIRFAHLLGSDYTEGIPGIGPVTALEIISDFGDLQDFKSWCEKVQLGRPQDLDGQLTTSFRRKFKKTVQKKLFLPTVFPDLRVDQAYLHPDVESDPQEFQWGVPDLDKLRSFLMATIGWSQDRTDEILVPVIRDMNKRGQEGTQANITRFFSGTVGLGVNANANSNTEGTAPRNRTGKESGRMKNAYARLRGEAKKRKLMNDPTDDQDGIHGDDKHREDDEPDEKEAQDEEIRSTKDDGEDEADISDSTTKKRKSKSKRKKRRLT